MVWPFSKTSAFSLTHIHKEGTFYSLHSNSIDSSGMSGSVHILKEKSRPTDVLWSSGELKNEFKS